MRWRVFLRQPLGVVGARRAPRPRRRVVRGALGRPVRPQRHRPARHAAPARAAPTSSAPTTWVATSSPGCSSRAVSLLLALVVTAFAVAIGTTLGALAGFFGGWVDRLVSLATDALLSMPVLGLAMVAGSVLRPNLWTLAAVLALVAWPTLARITRAQVLTLRERTYAEAARALGLRPHRVLFRHLMPNAVAPLIVAATLLSAQVLLIESALSFLGYGMRPPTPSWGGMLNEAQAFYRQSPWLAVFPGLAITLTVAALNFVGDALRAATGGRGG
jgi:peptide/nickel transport system permease protein